LVSLRNDVKAENSLLQDLSESDSGLVKLVKLPDMMTFTNKHMDNTMTRKQYQQEMDQDKEVLVNSTTLGGISTKAIYLKLIQHFYLIEIPTDDLRMEAISQKVTIVPGNHFLLQAELSTKTVTEENTMNELKETTSDIVPDVKKQENKKTHTKKENKSNERPINPKLKNVQVLMKSGKKINNLFECKYCTVA
jgi:hypothetical protein